MSSWSHRPRSCSSSRIGSPEGPTRARVRDAWISISATRPWTSGSSGSQAGQDPAQPQRVLAQRRPHPVVAGGGGVALVEDRDRPPRAPTTGGRPTRPREAPRTDAGIGERALGANDPLGDGGLGHEERARDLFSGQTAEQAERKRHARLGGEHRMAGDEDQPQQVVAHVIVERASRSGTALLLRASSSWPSSCVLPLVQRAAAEKVDGAMLRGGHEPGARIVRDARLRPPLERRDERVLRQILGRADVAHDPGEARDQPGGLDSPDRVDGAMCIGNRHGSQSRQLPLPVQGRPRRG